jgi:hypothetical protein
LLKHSLLQLDWLLYRHFQAHPHADTNQDQFHYQYDDGDAKDKGDDGVKDMVSSNDGGADDDCNDDDVVSLKDVLFD